MNARSPIEEFKVTLSENINFFIRLANINQEQADEAKAFAEYISQLHQLEADALHQFEEAERTNNQDVKHYLQNFQKKLSIVVDNIKNNKESIDVIKVIDDLTSAAQTPTTPTEKMAPAIATVGGIAGGIAGLFYGFFIGMGTGLGAFCQSGFSVALLLFTFLLSPPIALFSLGVLLGVSGIIGSGLGCKEGAIEFHDRTYNHYKHHQNSLEIKTNDTFQSQTFRSFFSKKPTPQSATAHIDVNEAKEHSAPAPRVAVQS